MAGRQLVLQACFTRSQLGRIHLLLHGGCSTVRTALGAAVQEGCRSAAVNQASYFLKGFGTTFLVSQFSLFGGLVEGIFLW